MDDISSKISNVLGKGLKRCPQTATRAWPDGTFGYTRDAIQAVFDATPLETAQKILGKTAIEVFNMR